MPFDPIHQTETEEKAQRQGGLWLAVADFFVLNARMFVLIALLVGGGYYFLRTPSVQPTNEQPKSVATENAADVFYPSQQAPVEKGAVTTPPVAAATEGIPVTASPAQVWKEKQSEIVKKTIKETGIQSILAKGDDLIDIRPTFFELVDYSCDANTRALWNMDMTENASAFLDACNGFNATRSGTWTDVVSGAYFRAAHSTTNAYARTASDVLTSISGGLTIDFWVKGLTASSQSYIITDGAEASACNFDGFAITNGPSSGQITLNGNGGACTWTAGSALYDGGANWHHVVLAWSGTTGTNQAAIYMDGVKQVDCSPTVANWVAPSGGGSCGQITMAYPNSLSGTFRTIANYDQFRISNTRRDDTWVSQQYAFVTDNSDPVVTGITSAKANGTYSTGEVMDILVNFNETVYVTGTPQLTLETGTTDRTINYLFGSGSTQLGFRYTVQSGDASADLDYVANSLVLNGGTIRDLGSNDASLSIATPGAAGSLGANKALVIDALAPTVAQVTAVPSPTNDTTPNYTFSSTEAGTITYGGDCSSASTSAVAGNNTKTFNALSAGTHSNCTVRVTDAAGNQSNVLSVNTFVIDTTAPTVAEVTPVTTPTSDTTPDYTFSSTEAGTITYGGSCSSATTSATAGNNTVTFNTLANGTYTDCTVRVTDAAGNQSNIQAVTSFTVDNVVTTCPTSGTDVTISSPCQYIAGTYSYSGTLTISAAVTAISNHPSVGQVILQSSSINVTSSGSVNASGYGYAPQAGAGAGAGTYQGGTHGGRGGGNSSAVYGSLTNPTTSGSGGYNGGYGGGAIKLEAASTLTINGTVSATGNSVGSCARTGGAGGSIWLDASAMAGSGTIDVRGSGGVTCGGGSPGSGGGGRIAAFYGSGTPSFTYRTGGGDSNFGPSGGSGTVYVFGPGATDGSLLLDNGGVTDGQRTPLPSPDTWTFDSISLQDGAELLLESGDTVNATDSSSFSNADAQAELYVSAGATFNTGSTSMTVVGTTITNFGDFGGVLANLTMGTDGTFHEGGTLFPSLVSLVVNDDGTFSTANTAQHDITSVTVNSGGLLTHDDNSTAHAYDLNLNVDTLTVNVGGIMSVSARGFDGGYGPGAGGSTSGPSQGAGGAGHGGAGGNGAVGSGGAAYDTPSAPVLLGSGGGNYNNVPNYGGEGGGRIRVYAATSVTVNGSLVANGSDGHGNYAGGGSGGSIWLETPGTFAGSGTIAANGGGTGNAAGGCGAGGIVKITYGTKTFSGTPTATGATSACSGDGAAGYALQNPPAITTLSPDTKTAGDAAFSLTVNGSDFTAGSVVRIGGSDRVTSFVSSAQLIAAILSGDIATAGLYSITVYDSSNGDSNASTLTVNNPVPVTTSVSPTSKTRNAAQFTLLVNGTNFVSGSVVKLSGSARATTYVSSTQLLATILASDLTSISTYSVTVTNGTPGGGTSNGQSLSVVNPVPGTSSISPSTKNAGDAGFILTVNGANFVSNSVVRFEGSDRPTTYVSATQLTATINAADIASAGTFDITVFTTTPSGGTSNAQVLTVTGNVTVSHSPSSAMTVDEVTVESTSTYAPGLDHVEIYLDGTGPGDLVHTCTLVGSPGSADCDFNVGALAYGSHTATVIAYATDLTQYEGEHTFHVSDYTTVNQVILTSNKTNATATATARYTLGTTLSGPVTITFPDGFTVTGPPTAEGSSSCLGNFSYSAGSRTVTAVKSGCSGIVEVGGMTVVNPPSGGVYYVSWVNDDPGGAPVYITAEDDINVTGNVDPYVTFRVAATASECDNGVDGVHDDTTPSGSGGTVALGTLSPLAVNSSGTGGANHLCTFVSTNAGYGYSMSVRSTNGRLYSASTGSGMPSSAVSGASTSVSVQPGNEAYGMCLASGSVGKDVSLPVGYDLAATSPFNPSCTASTGAALVGSLTTDANVIGSNTGPVQDGWAKWFVKASITSTTPPMSDLADTLTFIVTSTY